MTAPADPPEGTPPEGAAPGGAATKGAATKGAVRDGATASVRPASLPPAWLRSVALWVGAALALAVLVVLGVALLPGWWASVVGGYVQGVEDRGVGLGLTIGALFTVLPLLVGLLAFRSGLTSRVRIGLVVAALLLLLPNVLTIAVALRRSDARSVLAIEAPSFRGATVVGMVAVVVLVLVVVVAWWWARRTRRTVEGARVEAVRVGRERTAQARTADDGESSPPSSPTSPGLPDAGAAAPAPDDAGPAPRT